MNLVGWFCSLEGEWNLMRKISDGSDFHGTGIFTRDQDECLKLQEKGVMRLGSGEVFSASRIWVWSLELPATLKIFYPETPRRLYHGVNLSGGSGSWNGCASHLCGDDVYEGWYEFSGNRLSIQHHVRGPAKSYQMEAVYQRRDVGFPESSPRTP